MNYAEIKALSDQDLFAAYDAEEARIGSRNDAKRNLLLRLANEISYRVSDHSWETEKAERKFGC